MRDDDNPKAPLLRYSDALPTGRTVWGVALRGLRKRFGRTQADIAQMLGVDVRTIKRWEAGVMTPKKHKAKWYWDVLLKQFAS